LIIAEFQAVALFDAFFQELHVFPDVAHEQDSPVFCKKGGGPCLTPLSIAINCWPFRKKTANNTFPSVTPSPGP
jgi:hypothetical protein